MDGAWARSVLMVETRNELRSASVQTTSLFHHGVIPYVLVNPQSKGLLAFDLALI
jgi:hypothetical protein